MKIEMNRFYIVLLVVGFASCKENDQKTDKRPNILLIVADDLGYADLGVFGSDIATPNIDALAASGITFSRFHTAPTCAPTRAMLLSGNDNHIAGMGSQFRKTGEWGYEGHLSDRVVTIPQVLQSAGYKTYMAGKWHLGTEPEQNPVNKGFGSSFVLLQGGGNHYNDQNLFNDSVSYYTLNGVHIRWPDGEYSTKIYTDKLIGFIDENKNDERPFFALATYTSPHWPLQVDSAYWIKYKNRYNDGYEELRSKRLTSLKKAGMIPQAAELPELNQEVVPWDSLSPVQKMREARKMELYAGMVDNLDYHIGRLLQYLKDIDEHKNTLIVFMSDNGAAAEDFYNDSIADESYHHPYFNNAYENMGLPDSYVSYGPQWAEAGTAPFKYFKEFATEGGITTPMIISGPGIKASGSISDEFVTVMDLAPTFYQVAKAEYPSLFQDRDTYPLKGSSIHDYLSGKTDKIHNEDEVFAVEQSGNAVIRKGHWKIVNYEQPFDRANFKLYNLENDLAENYDLSDTHPEKFSEMLTEWDKYVKESRITFPEE